MTRTGAIFLTIGYIFGFWWEIGFHFPVQIPGL